MTDPQASSECLSVRDAADRLLLKLVYDKVYKATSKNYLQPRLLLLICVISLFH